MQECARTGCDNPAVALLSFSPQQAKAWLYDLHEPDSTGGIMLCRKHANATVVPMSWQLVDARDPAWPGAAPDREIDDTGHASTADQMTTGSSVDAPAAAPVAIDAGPPVPVGAVAAASLPTDSVGDDEFAALRDALPVVATPYVEPGAATRLAAGATMIDRVVEPASDPSLFELPLADAPPATRHADN